MAKEVEKLSNKKFLGVDWKLEAERLQGLKDAVKDDKSRKKYQKELNALKEKVVEARKEQDEYIDAAMANIKAEQKNIGIASQNKTYLRDLFEKFGI